MILGKSIYSDEGKMFYEIHEILKLVPAGVSEGRWDGNAEHLVKALLDKAFVIPVYVQQEAFLYREDVMLLMHILEWNPDFGERVIYPDVEGGISFGYKIQIRKDTAVYYRNVDAGRKVPACIRNVLTYEWDTSENVNKPERITLSACTIETSNPAISAYLQNALYRKHLLDYNRVSEFVGSGSYMGSKRKLGGFILESVYPFLSAPYEILDLMCGSGAVSNTFAHVGNVYASDSETFCRYLAAIQGSGFSRKRAAELIENMYPAYKRNLSALEERFSSYIQEEDEIFHMNRTDSLKLYDRYIKYASSMPAYSDTFPTEPHIVEEVAERRNNPTAFPYKLFSLYFANIFFSLSQCMELDSIRFAIDGLPDSEDRTWALGVLEVVTSTIATTYGGHFAQPKKVTEKNVAAVVQKRQQSAWLEFNARFLSIGDASEKIPGEIILLDGPWEKALKEIKDRGHDMGKLAVYLDAPYKREEYSRYYHVLETMALYDYPHSEGKGHMRSKRCGERFRTEFSTRTDGKIEDIFVEIISAILETGASCIWSYSNNGRASICSVIERVAHVKSCSIAIQGIDYHHSMQGAVDKRKKAQTGSFRVMEYCIVFRPAHNCG